MNRNFKFIYDTELSKDIEAEDDQATPGDDDNNDEIEEELQLNKSKDTNKSKRDEEEKYPKP